MIDYDPASPTYGQDIGSGSTSTGALVAPANNGSSWTNLFSSILGTAATAYGTTLTNQAKNNQTAAAVQTSQLSALTSSTTAKTVLIGVIALVVVIVVALLFRRKKG